MDAMDEPATLASLPFTAWTLITQHLSDSPTHLRMLSTLFPASMPQITCRPLFSIHFERIHTDSVTLCKEFPWHDALMLCLEGHLDPLFIHQAAYYGSGHDHKFTPTPKSRPALKHSSQSAVTNYDRLYREAAVQVYPGDIDEICREFSQGSDDAALAVLLPLCTRLKTLEISAWTGYWVGLRFLEAVVVKSIKTTLASGISSEQARRSAKLIADQDLQHTNLLRRRLARQDPDTDSIPFSELLVLWSSRHSKHNSPLQGFLPFMCIPSLHRIILSAMSNKGSVTWPNDPDLRCHCPEIYFAYSTIVRETLMKLVEGVHSICDIKQWYAQTTWNDSLDVEPDWDHAVITFNTQNRNEKTVIVSQEYDRGERGYRYGWMCHLYFGLTGRWDHLDDKQLPSYEGWYDDGLGGPGGCQNNPVSIYEARQEGLDVYIPDYEGEDPYDDF